MPEPQNGAIVRLRVAELSLHPACQHVPEMRPTEWAAFLADIGRCDVQDPLTVQEGGVVLDGRHRLRAATLLEKETIPCRVVHLNPNEQEAYVIRASLHRRNLTDDQRAIIAAKYEQILIARSKEEKGRKGGLEGGRGRAKSDETASDSGDDDDSNSPGPPGGPGLSNRARDEARATHNVSKNKLQKAGELLKTATPELVGAVEAGQVSLAGAKALANLPEAKQRSLVAGGEQAMKAALRQPSLLKEVADKRREMGGTGAAETNKATGAAVQNGKNGNGNHKKPDAANAQNAPFIEAKKLLLTMRTFLAAIQDFRESGALEDAQAEWPERDRREVARVADAIHEELSDWPPGFVSLEEARHHA